MAKVYSWEVIKSSVYAYIYNPIENKGVYVGPELKGDNLDKIINWTATVSDEVYDEHFDLMVKLCKEKGYEVNFDLAHTYRNVVGSCDNLRGPAGRGIESIYYKGTVMDEFNRNVDYYGIRYDDGTEDENGFYIRNGFDGKDGKDGIDGVNGIMGLSSITMIVYTSTEDEIPPSKPVGGVYWFETGSFECPDGWYVNDDNLNGIKWMSTKVFMSNNQNNSWSTPIRISGKDGENGRDGDTIEFVYKLGDDIKKIPQKPENNKDINDYIPEGWLDHPQGVDENNTVEWMCNRTKNTDINGDIIWGSWSEPIAWSVFGVNGVDGDGVQYLFLKNRGEIPVNPTPENWENIESAYQEKYTEFIPPLNETYTNKDGISIIFKPIKNVENNIDMGDAYVWTDSPATLNTIYQYQWVSVRKYRNGKWSEYSKPALWGKYGENGTNGTAIIKIYKTHNSFNEPPTPPNNSAILGDWSISFPKDYELGKNVVYSTESEVYLDSYEFVYRYKKIDNIDVTEDIIEKAATVESIPTKKYEDNDYIYCYDTYYYWSGGWCTPYIVTGVVGKDGASSKLITIYTNKKNDETPETPEGGYYDFENMKLMECPEGWYINDDNFNGITWMSIRNFSTIAEYTDTSWNTPVRLTGKNGKDGADGQSIEFIYKQSDREPTKEDKPNEPENTLEDNFIPEGWLDHPQGVDEINQYEWICTRTKSKEPNENGDLEWGEWVGPVVWSKYGVNGKDGDGIQYVFFKTINREDIPKNPTPIDWKTNEEYQNTDKEWIPNGEYVNINKEDCTWGEDNIWYDSAPDIDEEFKYIWVCMRKYRTSEVEIDKGEFLKVSRWEEYSDPKLWAKYPEKGLDGPQGPAGIPGVSMNFMFCLGTEEWCFGTEEIIHENSNNISKYAYWFDNDEIPSTKIFNIEVENYSDVEDNLEKAYQNGFVGSVVEVKVLKTNDIEYYYLIKKINNSDKFYVSVTDKIKKDETNSVYLWCVQGRETIDENDNKTIITQWGIPFKLQGANGLKGMDGKNAPVIYPMGIYDPNTTYEATDVKQPYVYDGSDGGFYLYNDLNNQWKGVDENDETPATHVSTGGTRWIVFKQFELLWSNVGVINNGLIGSAVFNNNFMFSQQGKDKDGNNSNKYQYFLDGYTLQTDGSYRYKDDKKVETVNPYEKDDDGNFIHNFMPNVCINFSTGDFWAGYGRVRIADDVYIEKDLFGKIGDFPEVEVDKNGNILWYHRPETESTGIFEGLFSQKTMENFLGKPSLWDEKEDVFTGGTGLLGIVTPQLNKIKPEKFKWNEDNNEFESVNPDIINNISVSGLNDFLNKYLGKPAQYDDNGDKINGGSGLFELANDATTNRLGSTPKIDNNGDIIEGTGLLGNLGKTLIAHVGTPPKFSNGETIDGSGMFKTLGDNVLKYIGTPPIFNSDGSIVTTGKGLMQTTINQVQNYIGTPPIWTGSGMPDEGKGIMGDMGRRINNYIGTPPTFNSDGSIKTNGNGLMQTAINQVQNYIGTAPTIDSNGDITASNGILGEVTKRLTTYIGTPPSWDIDGFSKSGTGVFKDFEVQVNNAVKITNSAITQNIATIQADVQKLGSPGYIDNNGLKVDGTGLLANLSQTNNVYGTKGLTVKNLTLSGYLLKTPTIIDNSNYESFLRKTSVIREIDITKCGSYIKYYYEGDLVIYLPGTQLSFYEEEIDIRQYIGQTFMVYNFSNNGSFGVSGSIAEGFSSYVAANNFIIAKCECTIVNGTENISWTVKQGKIKDYDTTNNPIEPL